jgi:hypothetical protein
MASGHVNRVNRPNTWLHRPMLQTFKKVLANSEPSTHGGKADIAAQACALSISQFLQGSDRTPARWIHSGELFALEINHSRSKPAMPANPAADFRGIDQPKNVGAERVPYSGRTRFCPRRMKAEPCFIGKASPVLRQQTKRQRTSREAVPVDYDSLTTQLQIQIFGEVLSDITATVIFDEYFAFGLPRVAGNTCKHQSNQQRPLCSPHGGRNAHPHLLLLLRHFMPTVRIRPPAKNACFGDVWLFCTSCKSKCNDTFL